MRDDRCAAPDAAGVVECLGLCWAGLADEVAAPPASGFRLWPALKRNNRIAYMTVDVAVLVLILVAIGVALHRRRGLKKILRIK